MKIDNLKQADIEKSASMTIATQKKSKSVKK